MVSQTEQTILALMLFAIMLGMGASMTPRDFLVAIKKPQGILIGAISQFGFMPMIAFFLSWIFQLSEPAALGLLIMGSVPGGTTSNLFTYFSKGNLALSVLMTVNSTLFAIVLTPLALWFWSSLLFQKTDFEVPLGSITQTLAILLVPVVVGMGLRRLNANIGAFVEILGSLLGLLFIFFLLVTWVPKNWSILVSTHSSIFAASLLLGVIGFFFGYQFSKKLKLHPRSCRTIALETGIQNGPLAVGIILLSFPPESASESVIVPALYSLFILISSSAITLFFRKKNTALEQKIPDLL